MRLGFETGFVDEDAGVGVEAGEGQGDVVVEDGDFGGRDAGVLEFEGGTFFAADDDDVFAFYADGAGSWSFSMGRRWMDGLGWAVPLLTASMAYSTWKTCPSGLVLLDCIHSSPVIASYLNTAHC